MIEKALIIIVFMYATSFSMIAGQYMLGDVFGVTMVNFEGIEVRSNLLDVIDEGNLNSVTGNLNSLNQTTITDNPIVAAGGLVWDIVTLLTGTYIFNMLLFFGVPPIFIGGMVVIYSLMLFRTLIGYLRGV